MRAIMSFGLKDILKNINSNLKKSRHRGAYFVEYAILLTFALIFVIISDFNPLISNLANTKTQNTNLNGSAYYEVAHKNHPSSGIVTPVINYSDNLVTSYDIKRNASNGFWEFIKKILKLIGFKFNDTYYIDAINLKNNTNYVIDIVDVNKTVTVGNKNYKLADFDFTYVVYAGSNTVTQDSNNIANVGWPVEIKTDGKSNQQIQFSFSHTNSSYNDNESIALKQLLSDNLMIKEKTITYNN